MPEKRDWRQRGTRGRSAGKNEPGSSGSPPPERGGWRRDEKPRKSPAAEGAMGGWLTPKSREADTWRFRYYSKLAFLGLVIAGLVYLLYLNFVQPRDVPVVAVAVTSYHDTIDPNAYAWEDIDRLRRDNHENINLIDQTCVENHQVKVDGLTEFLQDQLAQPPGGPNNDVIIVYISAHGVLDGNGNPCLLLADSDPFDSSSWLRVDELLKLIVEQVNSRAGSQSVKKLVILDSGRMVRNWRMGVLENGFPARLTDVVKQTRDPHLHVINSNHSGQRSWAAPERGGSVFGYFVADGIAGQNDEDGKVTLEELFDHVDRNVFDWVKARRACEQRPMLIHSGDSFEDFPLVYAGPESIMAPTQEQLDGLRQTLLEQWNGVFDLWKRAESLRQQQNVVRLQPLEWAELQQRLLRTEQLMLAGHAYESEFQDTIREAEDLLDRLASFLPDANPLTLSLPLADLPDDDLAQARKAWQAHIGPKTEEGDKQGDLPPIQYRSAVAVIWSWLVEQNNVSAKQLRDAVAFMDQNGQDRPVPDFTVANYVRMLHHDLDVRGDNEQARDETVSLSIRARDWAGKVANPSDERTVYFLHQGMDGLEDQRRWAEDRLMVGDASSLSQARETFQTLAVSRSPGESYEGAAEQAQRLGQLYHLRDEMYAELPYLAEWLVVQLASVRPTENSEETDRLAHELLPLIDELHTLSSDLEQGQIDVPDDEPAIAKSWGRLKSRYTERSRFLAEDQVGDARRLREIAAILAVPSLDVDRRDQPDRRNLLMRQFVERLCVEGLESLAGPAEDVSQADGVQEQENASRPWSDAEDGKPRHPALAILDRSQFRLLSNSNSASRPSADGALWLAKQGAEVRQSLARVPGDADDFAKRTLREPSSAGTVASPVDVRRGLSHADRLTRSAAALYVVLPDSDDRPREFAQRLRRLDRHFQVLWQCRQILDDFWGPVPEAGGDTDFYVSAVRGYLASAKELARGICRYDGQVNEVEKQLGIRTQAADAMAGSLTAEDSEFQSNEKDIPHKIQIDWQPGLPDGEATVYVALPAVKSEAVALRDVRQDIAIHRRGWLHDRQQQLPMAHLIPRDRIAEDDRLTAVLYYRGHRWTKDFHVPVPTGIRRYVTLRRKPDTAEIVVRGPLRTGHIMFVFDCSGSMRFGGVDRMRPAKLALQQLLRDLDVSEMPYKVGLRVYGNRFGFNRDLTVRPRFGAAVAPVHPDEDVQLIQPLEMLDGNLLAKLTDQLRIGGGTPIPLDAWGQTPLYLALETCFLDRDFRGAIRNHPKRIVVVTDGENAQRERKTTTARNVLVARQESGLNDVPIDIIGFDLKRDAKALQRELLARGNRDPEPNSMLELMWLARQTNGKYYSADEKTLGDQLRAALGLVQYSVQRVDGEPDTNAEYKELGEPWTVKGLAQSPGEFEIRVRGIASAPSERLTLEGGEDVVLEYNRLRNQLRYPDDDLHRRGDLRDAPIENRNARYRAKALIPRPVLDETGAWDFFVAIQEQGLPTGENRFTVRPEHVWAEIQPRTGPQDGGQDVGIAYQFYDRDFLDSQPVPVFRFRAHDWPASATAATLRLWFAMGSGKVTVNESRLVKATEEFQVQGVPEVSFRVSTEPAETPFQYRVVVTEKRKPSSNAEPLRIQLNPPPESIEHEHYLGVNTIVHRFDFLQQKPTRLQITSRSRIINNSIIIQDIDVPLRPR